jgi:glycosyltransferase involved in cell wall biosynthesis
LLSQTTQRRLLAVKTRSTPATGVNPLNDKSVHSVERAGGWICCQLGARDHYCVPRGLHGRGLLEALITEAWVPPTSVFAWLLGELGERLRERYDASLADAEILHFSAAIAAFETRTRLMNSRNIWDRIIARNNWFQTQAVQALRHHCKKKSGQVLFAYSYAAREILLAARELGCFTILGQIDPGPAEQRIVADVCLRRGNKMARGHLIPESYWDAWREECDLCHAIVVNSSWTRAALMGEGVPAEKIRIVPLGYDPPDQASRCTRVYPRSFCAARPLRVLFLGSLIPRKGIYEMLEATTLLRSAPVEFRFVGASGVESCVSWAEYPNLYRTGPIARKSVQQRYRNADVFILPTHSDGFGMTQLEAMAWGLPVIASKNCGEVVCHGTNGLLIPTVTAENIAEAVSWCVSNAGALDQMSRCAAHTSKKFRTHRVVNQLLQCTEVL